MYAKTIEDTHAKFKLFDYRDKLTFKIKAGMSSSAIPSRYITNLQKEDNIFFSLRTTGEK